jgi:hypothetical protein
MPVALFFKSNYELTNACYTQVNLVLAYQGGNNPLGSVDLEDHHNVPAQAQGSRSVLDALDKKPFYVVPEFDLSSLLETSFMNDYIRTGKQAQIVERAAFVFFDVSNWYIKYRESDRSEHL